MADLFQTSRTNIVEYIKHIYEEGEVDENLICQKFRQVWIEGKREVSRELPYYNLDMIISPGYRVKSKIATNLLLGPLFIIRGMIAKHIIKRGPSYSFILSKIPQIHSRLPILSQATTSQIISPMYWGRSVRI